MIHRLKSIYVITTLYILIYKITSFGKVHVLKSSYLVGYLITKLQLSANSFEKYSYALLNLL